MTCSNCGTALVAEDCPNYGLGSVHAKVKYTVTIVGAHGAVISVMSDSKGEALDRVRAHIESPYVNEVRITKEVG